MMQDRIPNYLRQRLVNLVDLPLRVIAPRAFMRKFGFSLPSEMMMVFFSLERIQSLYLLSKFCCAKSLSLYTIAASLIPIG